MPLLFKPALQFAPVNDIRKLQVDGVFYGRVVGSAIDFLVVALVVFLIAKYVHKEQGVS